MIFFKLHQIILGTIFFVSSFIVCANEKNITNDISIIDLYPWGYVQDGPQGIHKEIVNYLANQLGRPYKSIIKPYARVEYDLKVGTTPFSFLAGGAKNREDYAIKGPVVFELKFGIIVQEGRTYDSLSDLIGSRIAVMRGLKISDCFKFESFSKKTVFDCHPELKSFERVPIREYGQGLKMLNAGRVEGVVGSIPTMHELISKLNKSSSFTKVTLASKVFVLKIVPISIVYSKKRYASAEASRINNEIENMKKLGKAQEIYRQFIKE